MSKQRKWKRILDIWWRQLRRWRPAAVGLLLLITACAPTPEGKLRPFTYADSEVAIHQAFDPFGPDVYAQARAVASCESGLWPYAGFNKYYRGIFQLGQHIVAIRVYGGQYYDPYQNALAARDLYVSRGNNWSAWTCQPQK